MVARRRIRKKKEKKKSSASQENICKIFVFILSLKSALTSQSQTVTKWEPVLVPPHCSSCALFFFFFFASFCFVSL